MILRFGMAFGVVMPEVAILSLKVVNDIKSNVNRFSLHRHMIPRKFIGATHYLARSEHPSWASKLKRIGAYKNDIFYKV